MSNQPRKAMVDLFLAAAEAHPDRPALRAGGVFISYAEMLRQAEGLAGALIAGSGNGGLCGVLGRRSATFYASVIGSMLGSRVYVPLNPRFPEMRNIKMLDAARADALIVDGKCIDEAAAILAACSLPLLVLLPDNEAVPDSLAVFDRHRYVCGAAIRESRAAGRGSALGPNDGAYLLFTSGSTGKPKGVLVNQRNGLAYIDNVLDRYGPTPEDRFSQVFDPTFDLSIHDMFLCWASGACLYAAPDSGTIGLFSYVRKNELTFWFSVPSTAAFMERYGMLKPGAFPSLRWSLFCGEALPNDVARRWQGSAPKSTVENLYGPTEATIAFTVHRFAVDEPTTADDSLVPIGKPLQDQQVAIIDADDRPVESGVIGELCLGGSQVTPGYWQQPDLTAARFAPPKGMEEGTRWYRTGDLAIADADGQLRFMGRVDNQVKIRGYRVELQEVEGVLRSVAGTSLAAVVPLSEPGSDLAIGLVAFTSGGTADAETILQHCQQRLPEYMVPGRVVDIAHWPVNANGKTDTRALQRLLENENDADTDQQHRHAS